MSGSDEEEQITNNQLGQALQALGQAMQMQAEATRAMVAQFSGQPPPPTTTGGTMPILPPVPTRELVMAPSHPKADSTATLIKANVDVIKFAHNFDYDPAARSIISIMHQINDSISTILLRELFLYHDLHSYVNQSNLPFLTMHTATGVLIELFQANNGGNLLKDVPLAQGVKASNAILPMLYHDGDTFPVGGLLLRALKCMKRQLYGFVPEFYGWDYDVPYIQACIVKQGTYLTLDSSHLAYSFLYYLVHAEITSKGDHFEPRTVHVELTSFLQLSHPDVVAIVEKFHINNPDKCAPVLFKLVPANLEPGSSRQVEHDNFPILPELSAPVQALLPSGVRCKLK